jgi:hypothetical protein
LSAGLEKWRDLVLFEQTVHYCKEKVFELVFNNPFPAGSQQMNFVEINCSGKEKS